MRRSIWWLFFLFFIETICCDPSFEPSLWETVQMRGYRFRWGVSTYVFMQNEQKLSLSSVSGHKTELTKVLCHCNIPMLYLHESQARQSLCHKNWDYPSLLTLLDYKTKQSDQEEHKNIKIIHDRDSQLCTVCLHSSCKYIICCTSSIMGISSIKTKG